MPEEKPTKFTGWKLNVPGAPQAEPPEQEPATPPEKSPEPPPTPGATEGQVSPQPKADEPLAQKVEPEKSPERGRFQWTGETVWTIADRFINWEIIVLAFLLPIFFLPTTTEFFEFNKLSLLAVATILGYLAWGI